MKQTPDQTLNDIETNPPTVKELLQCIRLADFRKVEGELELLSRSKGYKYVALFIKRIQRDETT